MRNELDLASPYTISARGTVGSKVPVLQGKVNKPSKKGAEADKPVTPSLVNDQALKGRTQMQFSFVGKGGRRITDDFLP